MKSDSRTESKLNSDIDQLAGVVMVGAVLIGIALFVARFIPVALMGAGIGFLIYTACFQPTLTHQVKTVLRTAVFFALFFFIGFGLPFGIPQRWIGAFFYSKGFWETCLEIVRSWNGLVPNIEIFKSLKILKLSPLMVSQYVWLSFYTGLGFALFFFVLGVFGKMKSEISDLGLKVVSYPAFLVSKIEALLFSGWVRLGVGLQKENPLFFFIPGLILFGVGYFLPSQLNPRFSYFEFRWLANYITYLPLAGLSLGFGLSWIPIGSSLISFLFNPSQKPTKETPGFLIGKTFQGRSFRLTEKNLNYHVEIIAPTGSGKTNLLKDLIADRIQKGHGVIFLDFKAEFEIVSWIYRVSQSVGRKKEMRLLSLSNRELSVPYNPLKNGDATDIHSSLMSAMSWSNEFYRGIASVTLMTLVKSLCEYRDKTGELFHVGHLYELLDQPGTTRALADRMGQLGCPTASQLSELASRIEKTSERSNLMGLMSNLNQLLFSSAGPLLSQDVIHGSFDFREAISQGRISVMLMNSLKLKESAGLVGKMILQDLMSFVGDHYSQIDPSQHKPLTLIIDEFASFATPNFIEFMDRARGAGIGIVIAHQARADLRAISPEFQERVEANSNTTLVSGLKSSQDAEHYAGMLGTKTTKKETVQKKQGFLWDEETGVKSVREVEEFVLHPNRLKELGQGEIFAISRTIDPQWGLVNVSKAPEYLEYPVTSSEVSQHLKEIRKSYQTQNQERYLDLSNLISPNQGQGLKTKIPSLIKQEIETWS